MANFLKRPSPFRARFQRYECKYVITEDLAEGIRNYIRGYVHPDPHAAKNPDGCYDIQSLYLDGPDMRLFHQTQEGMNNRLKLRIRCYSTNEVQPVFLEIKRRCNGLVCKSRARIMRKAVDKMLKGCSLDFNSIQGEERACYDEFVSWVGRWTARPVMWVKYTREAYVGTLHPGVRVTMDRDLEFAPSTGTMNPVQVTSWRTLERRFAVLELKFNTAYPDWMRSLVQRFNLKRQSYSKYAKSILRGMDTWMFPVSLGPHTNERHNREHA